MFGYVTANKPEMKIREFARYKGFYCGLCRRLHKAHGRLGQMTLTYDMTFLIVLLTSLYESATEEMKKRCLIHPAKKQYMLCNEITEYAADMNILLTCDHLEDDWKDERKITGFLGMKVFAGKKKKIAKRYPRQAEVIAKSLAELSRLEEENCQDIDVIARPFGTLMAELFVWREDAFQNILRQIGFYLGKFIYIMDAYMDVAEDSKKECYNPFMKTFSQPGFEERVHQILDGTLRMGIAEFEKLPCEQDLAILRNILYEGVWTKYERKRNKNDE
ncbi:MAG: hypothetical protein J1F22_01685 [Lachnospiraceae bacterium]|nr:hypothetical protein [Lachnospiraceae bacterium]